MIQRTLIPALITGALIAGLSHVAFAADETNDLEIAYFAKSQSVLNGFDLRVIKPDGSNDRIVLVGVGGNITPLAWSPDGSEIAFAFGADISPNNRILAVAVDGSGSRIVFESNDVVRRRGGPDDLGWTEVGCFSGSGPVSGSVVLFIGVTSEHLDDDHDLEIFAVDSTGRLLNLTNTPNENYSHIAASPDGTRIATWHSGGGRYQFGQFEVLDLCSVDENGGLETLALFRPPVINSDTRVSSIDWSVDDLLAVKTSYVPPEGDSRHDIYTIDLQNTDAPAVRLTGGPGQFGQSTEQGSPSWSPDGKRLAFGASYWDEVAEDFLSLAPLVMTVATGEVTELPGQPAEGSVDWQDPPPAVSVSDSAAITLPIILDLLLGDDENAN